MAATFIMRYAFFSWAIWLILGAILLNAVVRLQATPTARAHSFPHPSASMESSIDRDEIFFQETSSISRKLSLQCAWQSKRVLAITRSFGCYAPESEKALRLHTVVAQVFYPVEIFFPRKVAPPSSENDPFLN
jgi:hypothetical protein